MQPKLSLLSTMEVEKVLREALQLLMNPGIKVQNEIARLTLIRAGARPISGTDVVQIPQFMVDEAIDTTPESFYLYEDAVKTAPR